MDTAIGTHDFVRVCKQDLITSLIIAEMQHESKMLYRLNQMYCEMLALEKAQQHFIDSMPFRKQGQGEEFTYIFNCCSEE